MAPALADAIERGVLVGEDPQPGRPAADLPAGLIDVLHDAVAGGLDQAVVAGLGQPPQAVAAADQRRRGDHQPGEGQEHRGALAIRGADAVLQVGGEPEQPGPELDGGGPQGVGGLLGVAALDAAEAGRAADDRDAEAGDDRLGLGQVDLVLVMDGDRGVIQRGVALRASGRQRDLDGAIDLFRWWSGPVTGRMTRRASRPLGVGLGRPLGEGCGLAFPRPPGLLQLGLEAVHLGAQLVDLPGLPGQVEEFVIGGRCECARVYTTEGPGATGKQAETRLPSTLASNHGGRIASSRIGTQLEWLSRACLRFPTPPPAPDVQPRHGSDQVPSTYLNRPFSYPSAIDRRNSRRFGARTTT